MLQFTTTYNGIASTHTVSRDDALLGRGGAERHVDVDLDPDLTVSRRHARVWFDGQAIYLEDLGSTHGTMVGDRRLAPGESVAIRPGSRVELGHTRVSIEHGVGHSNPTAVVDTPPHMRISSVMDAAAITPEQLAEATGDGDRISLGTFAQLPLEFSSCTRTQELCDLAVRRLVELLPAAQNAVILLTDAEQTGHLVLKAHHPPGEPPVSTTMAAATIQKRQACLWSSDSGIRATALQSVAEYHLQSAIAAPLCWQERTLGVLFLANCIDPEAFAPGDLAFAVAFSHYLALALASLTTHEELHHQRSVMDRLLTTFSPQVRDRLIEKARSGRLLPGGERSEVTILSVDIRNYSGISATMDAVDVLELLNAYFPTLTDCVLRHNGTVDKMIGDSIVAVFGSPEPDPDQYRNATMAAMDMQRNMLELNRRREDLNEVTCEVGVGVHCGPVLHGFVGSRKRLEFTVIGDAVNRACRYCDAAQAGEVLISPELYQHVWRLVRVEETAVQTKHGDELAAYRVHDRRPRHEDAPGTEDTIPKP